MALILFSGLAADSRIFVPQKLAFPELQVPPWLVPEPRESLDHYAQRMAAGLQRSDRPLWIGGASFGGILALHMSRYLEPDGVILLGSVREPSQLPPYVRRLRRLHCLVPHAPIRPWQVALAPLVMGLAGRRWPRLYGVADQMRRADRRVIRWSIGCLLNWNTVPQVDCPIHHIHGQRDIVLPARYTTPSYIVPGGGHIVSLTHPQQVTQWLKEILNVEPTAL